MGAPNVLDTGSPFWLRLYGKWVRLQGVMPVVDVSSQRAFSELLTVDGYRYEQRAPRGPRSWAMDMRYGTAASAAALEAAAYDVNFDDPAMRTLLYDENAARVNMLPPDLLTQWRGVGAGDLPAAHTVVNVGGPDGLPMWLPTYGMDAEVADESGQPYWVTEATLRGGVTYTVAVWSITLGPGNGAVVVLQSDGGGTLATLDGGSGTAENPHLSWQSFTPADDENVMILSAMQYTAGLMLYEGDCEPTSYRAGQRTPCSVSVHDPSRTTNLIWRNCDPCRLPREHTSWVLNEVGVDTQTPMDMGVWS